MRHVRTIGRLLSLVVLGLWTLPAAAQEVRGNAELSVGGGKVVVNYGRPQLKGRDPLTWQKDGSYWRMGSNDMTTLTSAVDLVFGETRLPKGSYGIWLLKVSADSYRLVFNSVTTGMGMMHDSTKDVASVPAKKEAASAPVETFTIGLRGRAGGGTFEMSWGSVKLLADFSAAR